MSNDLNKKILSDLTVHMKYAKFVPELNRRETWEELVTRNKEMHQKRYPELTDQIQLAYKYVYDKKFYQACVRFNLAESLSKFRRTDYTTAVTYLLIMSIALVNACFFFSLVVEWVIQFKNTISTYSLR